MKPMSERVDAELLAVANQLTEIGFNPDLTDIPGTREAVAAILAAMAEGAPPIEGVEMTLHEAPNADGSFNVPLRVFHPEQRDGTLPVMLWIHGGGYVLNKAEYDDAQVAGFAVAWNCVIVSVDYRLAPEHPFPVPLEDCYVGLKWTYDNAEMLGIDTDRITIGGQSAGGGLAAGLGQITRDRAEVPLMYQLLIYPMIDDRNLEQASDTVPDHYIWSRQSNLLGWRSYMGMEPGTDNTPLYAAPGRTENLEGLAPVYMYVGDVDLFYAEDLAYATRLAEAGVPVELHVYPGAMHAFDLLGAQTAIGQRCNADRDRVMKQVLHG
ncbi:MAG: alpha/beta hydrolase [Chloroflexota bacterium]